MALQRSFTTAFRWKPGGVPVSHRHPGHPPNLTVIPAQAGIQPGSVR
jgi:hypothetical protein